jgi:hypothetical protein
VSTWTPATRCSPSSAPRARDLRNDEGTPLRRVVWQPTARELEEEGAAIVDGDIELYRDDAFNALED